MIIVVVILSVALIVCAALIFLLKRDIRQLNHTLRIIEKSDTNMQATTQTFDKNIIELCNTINDILEKQKKIIAASEKSNREFRQAITNISHDLRTPLTSAIGYIQMIKSGGMPDDKKREYLDIIEHRLKYEIKSHCAGCIQRKNGRCNEPQGYNISLPDGKQGCLPELPV